MTKRLNAAINVWMHDLCRFLQNINVETSKVPSLTTSLTPCCLQSRSGAAPPESTRRRASRPQKRVSAPNFIVRIHKQTDRLTTARHVARRAGGLTARLTGHTAERGPGGGGWHAGTDGQTVRQRDRWFFNLWVGGKKTEKSGFYGPDKQTSGRTYRLTDTLLGCAKTGRRRDPNTLDILMWKLGCDAQSRWRKDVASLKTINMKQDSTLKCARK